MGAEPSDQPASLSPEEYLARERVAEHKSDYFKGEVFAMAGGKSPHSRLAANLIIALGRRLDTKPCETHTSDMKVHTPGTEFFAYPDVSLVCGEEEHLDESEDCILNPCLIAEVLSPSTQNYDREKFFHYQQLPSLDHYLLIHQDRVWIEHYSRPSGGGAWFYQPVGHPEDSAAGLKSVLNLATLNMDIPLSEIYRRLRIPPVSRPKS